MKPGTISTSVAANHPPDVKPALTVAILSREPMKNARQNATGINRLDWLAISFGIDTPGHRLPRFIANQAHRKLVGTLAGNDCGALDPFHDHGDRGPDWILYLTHEAHSARGNVFDVVDAHLISKLDQYFLAGGESFIKSASRLLDADQAANRQDKEIVPGPEQVERAAVFDQVRVVECKHLDQAQNRDESQGEEAEKQPPVNVQAAIVKSLRGDL